MSSSLKNFALATGIFYLLLALLELLYRQPFGDLLHFTPQHNLIHWLAALLLIFGQARGARALVVITRSVTIFFAAFFLATLATPALLSDLLGYPVTLVYKITYFLVGFVGLTIVFASQKSFKLIDFIHKFRTQKKQL